MTSIIKYDAACRALAEEASACMTKQEFITGRLVDLTTGERARVFALADMAKDEALAA